jgi:hypothetical protein
VRQIFELNGLVGRKHARGQGSEDYRESHILADHDLSKDTVTSVSNSSSVTALIPSPPDATLQSRELENTSNAIRSEQGPPQNFMASMGDAALPVATLPVEKLSQTPKVLARSGLRDMTNSAASTNRFPLPKAESPSKRAVTKAAGTLAHPGPLKTPARFAETSSQIKARGVGDRFASRPTPSCPACSAGAVTVVPCALEYMPVFG